MATTIFLSSPGDVEPERDAVHQVVRRLVNDPFVAPADLRVVSWDEPSVPLPFPVTESPQQAVDTMLPRPSECDIVVVILWSRLGTPLPSARFPGAPSEALRSGTVWEVGDALDAGDDGPDVLIYRKSAPVLVDLDDPRHEETTRQYGELKDYLAELSERVRASGGGRVRDFASLDEFRALLDGNLRHLLTRRAGAEGPGARTAVQWDAARSPYPGLAAFTPDDADVFFGREAEVDALVERLAGAPLVTVLGPSGSGKSSLVGAGLIRRLRLRGDKWRTPSYDAERRRWVGPRITPAGSAGDPVRGLAGALAELLEEPSREAVTSPGEDPAAACRAICEELARARPGTRTLIFADQFEEAFTTLTAAARDDLVRLLAGLADDGLAAVVLSLRADFLGLALEHEELAPHLGRTGVQPLAPPGLATVTEMINEPARVAGLRFDRDLPERLLVDTRQEPGRLPLLAFALAELYRLRDGDRLTEAAYDDIGGVPGAVGRLAETACERIGDTATAELPQIFRGLVDVDEVGGPVRRKAGLGALRGTGPRSGLVDALIEARLLVVGGGLDGRPYVELAHEALFRAWPELTAWVEAAHDDLRAVAAMRRAAAEWERCRRDRLHLWPQERMDTALAAMRRLDTEPSETERDFLRPETERLLAELRMSGTPHARRREIAGRIAVLGDPRPGVGVDRNGLPDIAWCRVDGLGHPFWIAKYPVTAAQLDAYRRSRMQPDRGVRTGLEEFQPSVPAPVNFREAEAYAGWTDANLRRVPGGFPPEAGDGYEVRIPTVSEWMVAAGGGPHVRPRAGHSSGLGRYPWGEEWDPGRANTRESGLGEVIAAGMYPLGDAPCGAADMVGNVWEWCLEEILEPRRHAPRQRHPPRYRGRRRTAGDDTGETERLYPVVGGSTLDDGARRGIDVVRTMRGDIEVADRAVRLCLAPAVRHR